MIAWRPITPRSADLAWAERDERPAGTDGRRQPQWRKVPGGIDERPQGAGDGEDSKVQTPFAQGGTVGHRWLAEELYSACVHMASWHQERRAAPMSHKGCERRPRLTLAGVRRHVLTLSLACQRSRQPRVRLARLDKDTLEAVWFSGRNLRTEGGRVMLRASLAGRAD